MADPKMFAEWFWIDRWMGSSAFLLPMEARGLYREMLSQAWRRGAALPNDPDAIRRAVGCSEKEWRRSWPTVAAFWRVDGDALVNDTQREIYAEAMRQRDAKAARAAAAAAKRWGRELDAQASPQASPQASAPASPPVVLEECPPISVSRDPVPIRSDLRGAVPVPAGARASRGSLITSPLEFDRVHGKHVAEFCAFVCLPRSVFDGFVNRLASAKTPDPEAVALAWARQVRAGWEVAGDVPGADIFAFWRDEWARTHPGPARPDPARVRRMGLPTDAASLDRQDEAIQQQIAAARRRAGTAS